MKRKLIWLIFLSIGIFMSTYCIYKLVDMGIIQINTPSEQNYSVRGVDVSHHNGVINWKNLAKTGTRFAFIKATEGGDFKDRRFNENWQKAQSAGITVGAYHFFTFCRPAQDQLDNFIDSVPLQSGTLPPVIDFEFGGNCKARPKPEQIKQELKIMMDGLEYTYGQEPIIYVTYEAYDAYIHQTLPNAPIWIRDIFKTPNLPENREWVFWQYSARGRLNGALGPIDLNTFNGTDTEFLELLRP